MTKEMTKKMTKEVPQLVSTYLVTAALSDNDMEAELLIEDPEDPEVAIAQYVYSEDGEDE